MSRVKLSDLEPWQFFTYEDDQEKGLFVAVPGEYSKLLWALQLEDNGKKITPTLRRLPSDDVVESKIEIVEGLQLRLTAQAGIVGHLVSKV